MRNRRATLLALVFSLSLLPAGCGGGPQRTQFVTVIDTPIVTLDPLDGLDAASERLRQLMFNSLMRKNEKFEYVGDLAGEHQVSEDGKTYTFRLRDGVTFHDGRPMSSADAKYTLDSLLASQKKKRAPFYETVRGGPSEPYVTAVEAPDPSTLVIRLRKPWIQLLSNLVSVPVIPVGSADAQASQPVGTGPFKFVRHDESQRVTDLVAFDAHWQGAPAIKELRVRAIPDANTLQAELQSGNVDLVSGAANLSPDSYRYLARSGDLKVEQFPGANIVYLGYNVEAPPLDNVKVRQAIAHAVNREAIVRDLMLGQARVAHSILPEASWAYDAGQKYSYDLNRAKELLDEAGFRDPDGDGPRTRFPKPIPFKISAGNTATSQFVGDIQNSLKSIGVDVAIETYETPTLIEQLTKGQYGLTTLRWVGGNQDPIFLRDLFHSGEVPTPQFSSLRNRGRYRNPEFDRVVDEAIATLDREKARPLYVQAQQIISRDVPLLPLWYPDVLVIARTGVENIRVDPSNDFGFLRTVTVAQR